MAISRITEQQRCCNRGLMLGRTAPLPSYPHPPPESKLSSQSGARKRRTATLTLFVRLIVFPSSLSGHVAVEAANDRGKDFKSACTQSACEDVVLPERNVLVKIFSLHSGLQ